MPTREMGEWMLRGAVKPLWPRRLEMMMAQVCLWLARGQGHGHLTMADFDLFAEKSISARDAASRVTDNAMVISALAGGVGVKMLGQGRRKPKVEALH